MSDPVRIPVTVLTGFLGAGKSTLLCDVLADPRFSDTAVIVNEFGEVGLDGALVTHADGQVVEMTTGCLCCTVSGDIRQTLLELNVRAEAGEIPRFSRVVVETTGLADPAPVMQTLTGDPRLTWRFALAGVVTVVDAVTGDAALDRGAEAVRQAAVADRLVISKADLARDPASLRDLALLKARLGALNPTASMLDRHDADFDLARLFDMAPFDPTTKSMDIRGWLNAAAHDHHHHHDHDPNRHGDVRAFCITLDAPVDTMAFTTALQIMLSDHGARILRLKGVVCLREKPERPVAIHGVRHVFHDPVILDGWPDDDRRTRLVFITEGLYEAPLRAFFEAWTGATV